MQNIEKIYEEYFETVYKYLFCLTHDNNIAEDLTQETFCKLVKKINTYKGKCKMSVWLCEIAKNLWYDQCKSKKASTNCEKYQLFNVQCVNSVEENAILNEEKIELYKRIQKLELSIFSPC